MSALSLGCAPKDPENGSLKCSASPPYCPSGYECVEPEGTCWKSGSRPDSGPALDARDTSDDAADARGDANPAERPEGDAQRDGADSGPDAGDALADLPDAHDATPDQPADNAPDLPGDVPLAPDTRDAPEDAPGPDLAQPDTAPPPVCQSAADGTPCGTDMVCSKSECVSCVAGGSCKVSAACHKGKVSCATGTADCVDDGNAEDGTDCGGGNVCKGGSCTACVGGTSCPMPGAPCRTGILTCLAGEAKCVDSGAKPDGTTCDDANPCTSGESCRSGLCTGGTPKTCPASDQCHDVGVCDTSTGACSNPIKASGASCSDGSECTTGDTCAAGKCVGGPAPSCNDNNPCTDDACNPSSGCTHTNNTASCSDGNACNGVETCSGGACAPGTAPNCDDNNVCTTDTCNASSGCTHTNNTSSCDDGDKCTNPDTCSGGKCVGGTRKTCTASDQCHDAGTCNASTGQCSNPNKPNGTACNDNQRCTTADKCQNGTCTGAANPCTHQCYPDFVGTCNPADGTCSWPPNSYKENYTPCTDDNACTIDDYCYLGTCFPGQFCPPANTCWSEGTCNGKSCDPGFVWTGDSCTKTNGSSGTCNSSGDCV